MSIDVEDSIKGFVKPIERKKKIPFIGIYQSLVSSYMFFKKLTRTYNPDFFLVTGGLALLPKSIAEKTIVYVHFPTSKDLKLPNSESLRVSVLRDYTSNIWKRLYIQPYLFISNNIDYDDNDDIINFDYIKKATIITNSNYTKNVIKKVWNIDCTVLYPPCPQYSFPLEDKIKKIEKDTKTVCSLGRFIPKKNYDTILQIAKQRPQLKFELIGGVTENTLSYLNRLKNKAPKNVTFHVNASIDEKIEILKRSKILLHSFKGEHFGIALIEAMSAGLIPISHNSGAAKEDNIVEERFRYNDLDSALNCIDRAVSEWNLDKASQLRQYAQNFSMENYNKNLKLFITNWIKSHSHLFKMKE